MKIYFWSSAGKEKVCSKEVPPEIEALFKRGERIEAAICADALAHLFDPSQIEPSTPQWAKDENGVVIVADERCEIVRSYLSDDDYLAKSTAEAEFSDFTRCSSAGERWKFAAY